MPELPEVQTVVDTLRPHVVGRVVREIRLNRADFATPAEIDWNGCVAGRTVIDLHRRAKRIVFTLGDGCRFYAHLGMTGRMTFDSPEAPTAPHTHAILHFDHGQVRCRDPRRFGGLVWLGTDDGEAGLGPEPLELRAGELARRLSRTRRPIKSALLDQGLIVGLGNIYADEALFGAGVHPLTRCCDLDREAVGRLSRAIKSTLRTAIRHRGSTLRDYVDAAGNRGGFQSLHRVYAREGEACSRCRKPIERIVLGGRSTHFCPHCQPAVAPVTAVVSAALAS